MNPLPENNLVEKKNYGLDTLQRFALGGILILVILTFVGANLHALLWQSSHWLVSTVLPAVVIDLTNEKRTELNEQPLKRSTVLDGAAQMKAQHMAKNEYFAHYAPDGTSPWYWFDKANYVYAYAGENLAIHFTDSTEVVDAWMNSPKHRENIASSNFTEIGVGTAKGTFEGYDTVYVVQLFGTPAQVPVAAAPYSVKIVTATPVVEAPELEIAKTVKKGEESVLAVNSPAPDKTDKLAVVATTSSTTEAAIVVATATSEDTVIAETTDDSVVLETTMISTSSGLAVANIMQSPEESQPGLMAGIATKPNVLLQYIYAFFGLIVLGLLLASIFIEARRTHYIQMFYGGGLLIVMAGLWYVHSLLTMGAVIV